MKSLPGLLCILRIRFAVIFLMPACLVLLMVTISSCKKDDEPSTAQMLAVAPRKLALKGDLGIHDPCIIKANGIYYGFSTGIERETYNPGGIRFHVSDNNLNGSWSSNSAIPVPEWAITKYKVRNIWAPELVYNGSDGKYYIYYAAFDFNTDESGIGAASTSDPSFAGNWTDLGEIITSAGHDYGAVDPNVFYDSTSGDWYMSWGSFFSGIKIQKMSSMTTFTGEIFTLAERNVENNPVEASCITKRGEYYYLFVAWDYCCEGISSDYKTVVGRSTAITGPYLDENGIRMDQGGGTILMQSNGNEIGPGGADVYQEGDKYYLVYHYYAGNDGGLPKLAIRMLGWDTNDWPVL